MKRSMRQATWLFAQSLVPKCQATYPNVLQSQAAQLVLNLFDSVQCLTGELAETGEISP